MTPAEWAIKIKAQTVTTASGCWEYQGTRGAGGYGRVWHNGRRLSTSRLTAVVHLGLNPADRSIQAHLFLGTASDNALDAITKGRRERIPASVRKQTICARGHDKHGRSRCLECYRIAHTAYMREYRKRARS